MRTNKEARASFWNRQSARAGSCGGTLVGVWLWHRYGWPTFPGGWSWILGSGVVLIAVSALFEGIGEAYATRERRGTLG